MENIVKGVHTHMITLENAYYLLAIVGILCGAAYKLGYENGKNAKSNRPSLGNLAVTFL